MTEFNNKKRKFPIFTIARNIWRREGEKAKERKKTHLKKPPGYRSRATGRIVFWVAFGFMFVVVITNVFAAEPTENNRTQLEKKENEAASQEGVEYAKTFANQYFTWSKSEDENNDWVEERQNRLKPFLAKGLPEDGGLETSGMQWSSSPKKITLAKVEEKGDNKAFITLYVEADFTKKTKIEETIKKDDKEEKKEVEKVESKPFTQYFVVPIAYQSNTFGVYQLPKYTNLNQETSVQLEQKQGLREYTGNVGKMEDFLNTFFTTYAEDNTSKLSFMLEDKTNIQALDGKMKFLSLESTDIKTDKEGNIQTFSTIQLQDQQTGTIFASDYSLVISNKQGRFLVKEINQ
ncbi:conjugal transfer protein [Priestia aryabhattai]|uniref:conjugal transfer protein n=1 Tax=Priestia aryabhattai TaxID=412384 RepID=UPI003D2BC9C5